MIKDRKSLSNGIQIIKNELLTIPNKPGVYQMIGTNEEKLYIGCLLYTSPSPRD